MITFSAGAGVPYLWWDSTAGSGEGTHGSVNASKVNIYFETSDFASGYSWPLVYTYEDLGGTVHTMYSYGGSPALVLPANSDGIIAGTKSAVTYTLSYNGNGATGGSTASQTGGTTYTVRSCGFTKTGHTFQYWTSGSYKYYPGDSITLTANRTLYAYWKANTYTVAYNANGGSGAPSSQTKYYGTTLTLSSTKPTWSGHTFLGWSTSSDRNAEVQYQAGGKYTANAGATLYAVWQVSAAFYNKGSLYSQSYARIGGSVTLPTLSNTEAETFEGWLGDDGETYRAGSTVTLMQNHTFTAIWKAITYTVSYNTNGGTGGPANGVKVHGTAYTIPSSKPKKTGYIFIYWVDNLESGKHWLPGDSYTTNSNVTFTAIWRQKTYFYWHGSDASDSTYFAVGKRIDLAVTAEAWNRLCDFVNEVRGYAGLSTIAFSTVSAGDEISAVKHTIVSNAIKQLVNAGYGTVVPATVSTGDEIVTSLYNGNGSLKDAINKAVDEL